MRIPEEDANIQTQKPTPQAKLYIPHPKAYSALTPKASQGCGVQKIGAPLFQQLYLQADKGSSHISRCSTYSLHCKSFFGGYFNESIVYNWLNQKKRNYNAAYRYKPSSTPTLNPKPNRYFRLYKPLNQLPRPCYRNSSRNRKRRRRDGGSNFGGQGFRGARVFFWGLFALKLRVFRVCACSV